MCGSFTSKSKIRGFFVYYEKALQMPCCVQGNELFFEENQSLSFHIAEQQLDRIGATGSVNALLPVLPAVKPVPCALSNCSCVPS